MFNLKRYKRDPYDGFKSDRERRWALHVRELCQCVTLIAVAISAGSDKWAHLFRSIRHVLQ